MELFLKWTAGVLVTLIICLVLAKQGKDISTLLALAVCSMVLTAAIAYLEPIFTFLQRLESLGNLDSQLVKTLLKAVGIGLLSEIAVLICNDAGNSAMGKSLQLMASAAILALSVPIFTELLEVVENILVSK